MDNPFDGNEYTSNKHDDVNRIMFTNVKLSTSLEDKYEFVPKLTIDWGKLSVSL